MGERRAVLLVAIVACSLAGCATVSGQASGGDPGVPGTRLTGSVQLLEGDAPDCWTISYKDGGHTVAAPLVVPDGYHAAHVVMADPMHPGHDYPNPALVTPQGDPVGFATTGVMVDGVYVDADDPAVAAERERCGWSTPPLVAQGPGGVSVDPDGLSTIVRTCEWNGDGMPLPGTPMECVDETVEPWNED